MFDFCTLTEMYVVNNSGYFLLSDDLTKLAITSVDIN